MSNIEVSNELLAITVAIEKTEVMLDELYQGYFGTRTEAADKALLLNDYGKAQTFTTIAHDYAYEATRRANALMETLDKE